MPGAALRLSMLAAVSSLVVPLSAGTAGAHPAAPTATVTSVAPRTGLASGGTRVVIHGTGFGAGSACGPVLAVAFGGYPGNDQPQLAARFSIRSATTIVAVTPASYAGTVDAQVQTRCGRSAATARGRFTFRYDDGRQCLRGSCPLEVGGSDGRQVRHVASGLLNGNLGTVTAEDVARLDALHLTSWRIGNSAPSSLAVATKTGAATTLLLESDWLTCQTCGDVQQPWTDPSAFESFVRQDVSYRELHGTAPRFWEVWNEPGTQASPDQWLSVYDAAYQGAKAADPAARVIGPTLASFDLAGVGPAASPGSSLGLRTFVRHAAANREAFAAISYHDEGAAGAPLYQPQLLAAHARAVRRLLRGYPLLRHSQVFINEYGPIAAMQEPGWIVGDMAALEAPAVSQADYTCPTSDACVRYFDGLLGVGGVPQLSYWVFKSFAQLQGHRAVVSTTGSNLTAVAATDDAQVDLLLGRHDACGTPPEQFVGAAVPSQTCPGLTASARPAVAVPLTLHVPWPAGVASVRIRLFRNQPHGAVGHRPVPNEPAVTVLRIRTHDGTIQLPSTAQLHLRDGDAASVIVSH